jgi:hypothetical protein
VKKSPKCTQPIFSQNKNTTFNVEKSSPTIWAISVSFRKLPKVSNRPRGEKSPNLVGLFGNDVKKHNQLSSVVT